MPGDQQPRSGDKRRHSRLLAIKQLHNSDAINARDQSHFSTLPADSFYRCRFHDYYEIKSAFGIELKILILSRLLIFECCCACSQGDDKRE